MEVLLDLKACPWCGGENWRGMGDLVDEEISKGNIDEGTVGAVTTAIHIIMNPLKPPLAGGRTPALKAYQDFCVKCGRSSYSRIEKGWATLPLKPGGILAFA